MPLNTKNVSLSSLNVGGITSKFRYNILSEYVKKYDILMFGETRLQKIPKSKFPNYEIFTQKQKTPKHGLALLVKKWNFLFHKKIDCNVPLCFMGLVRTL